MGIPNYDRYKLSLDKLEGKYTAYFSPQKWEIDQPERGELQDCSVRLEDRGSKLKPYIVVYDRNGNELMRLNGLASQLRRALETVAEQDHVKLSWEPIDNESLLTIEGEPRQVKKAAVIPMIAIDTETTGLYPKGDEILQLSIVDERGNKLFDRYFKPETVTSWPEAARINHITKKMVKDKQPISQSLQEIQEIFDSAQQVCGWHVAFDLAFLAEAGLQLDMSKVVDTMSRYGRKYHARNFYKLSKAAREQHYNFSQHNSLNDAKATIYLQNLICVEEIATRFKADLRQHSIQLAEQQRYEKRQERIRRCLSWLKNLFRLNKNNPKHKKAIAIKHRLIENSCERQDVRPPKFAHAK